jgi:hypothetical protein
VLNDLQPRSATTFSEHPHIDAHLQTLYRRVLDGALEMQTEIDSFIFVQLMLDHPETRRRLLALNEVMTCRLRRVC